MSCKKDAIKILFTAGLISSLGVANAPSSVENNNRGSTDVQSLRSDNQRRTDVQSAHSDHSTKLTQSALKRMSSSNSAVSNSSAAQRKVMDDGLRRLRSSKEVNDGLRLLRSSKEVNDAGELIDRQTALSGTTSLPPLGKSGDKSGDRKTFTALSQVTRSSQKQSQNPQSVSESASIQAYKFPTSNASQKQDASQVYVDASKRNNEQASTRVSSQERNNEPADTQSSVQNQTAKVKGSACCGKESVQVKEPKIKESKIASNGCCSAGSATVTPQPQIREQAPINNIDVFGANYDEVYNNILDYDHHANLIANMHSDSWRSSIMDLKDYNTKSQNMDSAQKVYDLLLRPVNYCQKVTPSQKEVICTDANNLVNQVHHHDIVVFQAESLENVSLFFTPHENRRIIFNVNRICNVKIQANQFTELAIQNSQSIDQFEFQSTSTVGNDSPFLTLKGISNINNFKVTKASPDSTAADVYIMDVNPSGRYVQLNNFLINSEIHKLQFSSHKNIEILDNFLANSKVFLLDSNFHNVKKIGDNFFQEAKVASFRFDALLLGKVQSIGNNAFKGFNDYIKLSQNANIHDMKPGILLILAPELTEIGENFLASAGLTRSLVIEARNLKSLSQNFALQLSMHSNNSNMLLNLYSLENIKDGCFAKVKAPQQGVFLFSDNLTTVGNSVAAGSVMNAFFINTFAGLNHIARRVSHVLRGQECMSAQSVNLDLDSLKPLELYAKLCVGDGLCFGATISTVGIICQSVSIPKDCMQSAQIDNGFIASSARIDKLPSYIAERDIIPLDISNYEILFKIVVCSVYNKKAVSASNIVNHIERFLCEILQNMESVTNANFNLRNYVMSEAGSNCANTHTDPYVSSKSVSHASSKVGSRAGSKVGSKAGSKASSKASLLVHSYIDSQIDPQIDPSTAPKAAGSADDSKRGDVNNNAEKLSRSGSKLSNAIKTSSKHGSINNLQ